MPKVRAAKAGGLLYQLCSVMTKGLPLVRQLRFKDNWIPDNFAVVLAGLEGHLRAAMRRRANKRQAEHARRRRRQAERALANARVEARSFDDGHPPLVASICGLPQPAILPEGARGAASVVG